jgi:hypothetical protein
MQRKQHVEQLSLINYQLFEDQFRLQAAWGRPCSTMFHNVPQGMVNKSSHVAAWFIFFKFK